MKPPVLAVGCSFNIQCLQLPPGMMLKISCRCLVLREWGEEECSLKHFPKAFCNPSPAISRTKPWGCCLSLPHGLSFKPASPVWSCAGSQPLGSSILPCVTCSQDITACQDILQPPRLCQPYHSYRESTCHLTSPCLHWPSHHLNLGDYVHPGQVSGSLDHMCSQLLFNSDASGRRSSSLPAF